MDDVERTKLGLVAPLAAGLFIACASVLIEAGQGTGTADARDDVSNAEICPPDNSSIALFTRQAFDQGRESEGREYGKFTGELIGIARSRDADDVILERSIMAAIAFGKNMRARGHDVKLGDIIIHLETELNFLIRGERKPISRAGYELQLAIIREMKLLMCRR